jgi:hypothetical protein
MGRGVLTGVELGSVVALSVEVDKWMLTFLMHLTGSIFPREEGSLSCLRLTQRLTPMSTTRLYRGYVNCC